CHILVLNVIRKDEDVIWGAFEDLIKRSIVEASFAVSGVYVFDVLTKSIHKEVKFFRHAEITALLANHARKCGVGEKRLIKYSSIYGILHKLNAVDWGKITLKTAVEIYKDKDSFFDLMLKKLIKNLEFSNEPGLLMINDLSQNPIYNASDELQQKRFSLLMAKQISTSIEFIPEVYIQDANGIRELYSMVK
ncbi:MAG: hypothetical protein P9X22_04930, partial [Candidatus Zapsychrus exili]|nr:hypothetical protein [Candidatus Zapsychrus exili]